MYNTCSIYSNNRIVPTQASMQQKLFTKLTLCKHSAEKTKLRLLLKTTRIIKYSGVERGTYLFLRRGENNGIIYKTHSKNDSSIINPPVREIIDYS